MSQTTQQAPPPLYMSPQEAAIHCGVNERTIRRYISDGTLPASRLAGKKVIRIRTADVEAMLVPIPAGGAA